MHTIGNPSIDAVGSVPGATLFTAQSSAGTTVATLDDAGNLHLSGKIFTSGSCKKGCIAGSRISHRAVAYIAAESQPTIEDFGEAQLNQGHAHVALDRAFGNRIDDRSLYLVFITPEGDTRGVYVANWTQQGFDVIENASGNSSVDFAYRIVAIPYGDTSGRLPMEVLHVTKPVNVRLPVHK